MKKIGLTLLLLLVIPVSLTLASNEQHRYSTTTEIPSFKEIGNGSMDVMSGEQNRFRTKSGTHIQLRTNSNMQIQVNETTENPVGFIPNRTRTVNTYMHIELNGTCTMNATMYKNYTNAELGEFGNASTFKWAFYNGTMNSWEYVYTWYQYSAKGATVSCNTTHFSLWSIFAALPNNSWNLLGNGSSHDVVGGTQHQFRTEGGSQIRLRTNETLQLRINETETNPAGNLPNRTRSVYKYMNIHLNGTCAMNATMMMNFTNQEMLQLGNVSTYTWAFFNESTNQWQYVHSWYQYTANGASLFANTTHFSTWTILAIDSEEAGPPETHTENPTNGSKVAVQAGHKYQITTQSGYMVQLQAEGDVELTVTEYEEAQHQFQNRHQRKTQVMTLNLNESVKFQANLSFEFTNQIRNQLGVQNKSQLRFMFYNETSGEWEAPKHQWLEGDTLYCNTTHFSTWTVVEVEEETVKESPSFLLFPLVIALAIFTMKRRK